MCIKVNSGSFKGWWAQPISIDHAFSTFAGEQKDGIFTATFTLLRDVDASSLSALTFGDFIDEPLVKNGGAILRNHRSDFASGSNRSILLNDLVPLLLPSPGPALYPLVVLPCLGSVTAQLLVRFSRARSITSFLTFSGNLRVYRSKFSPGTTNEWPSSPLAVTSNPHLPLFESKLRYFAANSPVLAPIPGSSQEFEPTPVHQV
ncbi:hypothetical protein H5410_017914 [Solanum commersonii]|uniref:Uncharacterized protein n=1 Tax=Solanum commersonii TaxID=4109 RepID=A0A9J6A1C6_SOLCO|nr:hypothetical protein H5410_017914 [Solanum commersonii]